MGGKLDMETSSSSIHPSPPPFIIIEKKGCDHAAEYA